MQISLCPVVIKFAVTCTFSTCTQIHLYHCSREALVLFLVRSSDREAASSSDKAATIDLSRVVGKYNEQSLLTCS